jgi:hypothetical protein
MSPFHLDCDFSIALFGRFLNVASIEDEVVAIDVTALENRHSSALQVLNGEIRGPKSRSD